MHPWFVHSQTSGWEQRLRQHLLARPDAMVGEAGVDKARLDAPWEAQVHACAAQLDLAAELRRPIVLHCVRAQGFLLELLARRPLLPPVVVHHAYGGSVESAAALLRLPTRSYFGWSGRAARLRKSAAVMASLPADRLLIESDEHEAAPAAEAVSEACAALAAARGWTHEETAARTAANARQAFGAGAEPWSAWGTGALEGTS